MPDGTTDWEGQLREVSEILKSHEKEIRCSTIGLPDRLRLVLDHYRNIADRSMDSCRSFRDDFVTWLRAIQLNLAIVEGGYTHAEKNARLRGFEELISNVLNQLRDAEFSLEWSHWRAYPDLFDPVDRRMFSMVNYLKNENQELRRQLDACREETNGTPEDADVAKATRQRSESRR